MAKSINIKKKQVSPVIENADKFRLCVEVDMATYRKFKAYCALNGIEMRHAADEAISAWLSERS